MLSRIFHEVSLTEFGFLSGPRKVIVAVIVGLNKDLTNTTKCRLNPETFGQ